MSAFEVRRVFLIRLLGGITIALALLGGLIIIALNDLRQLQGVDGGAAMGLAYWPLMPLFGFLPEILLGATLLSFVLTFLVHRISVKAAYAALGITLITYLLSSRN